MDTRNMISSLKTTEMDFAEDLVFLAREWNLLVKFTPYPSKQWVAAILPGLVQMYSRILRSDINMEVAAEIVECVSALVLESDSPEHNLYPKIQQMFASEEEFLQILRDSPKNIPQEGY